MPFNRVGLIKQGYDKPDIIKIDVEGAEFDVLTGAKILYPAAIPAEYLISHT